MNKWLDVPTGTMVRPFNVGRQAMIGYMLRSDLNAVYLTMPVEYADMIWTTADKYKATNVITKRHGDKIVAKVEW